MVKWYYTGKPHGQKSLVGYSPWDRRVRHNLATKEQQLRFLLAQCPALSRHLRARFPSLPFLHRSWPLLWGAHHPQPCGQGESLGGCRAWLSSDPHWGLGRVTACQVGCGTWECLNWWWIQQGGGGLSPSQEGLPGGEWDGGREWGLRQQRLLREVLKCCLETKSPLPRLPNCCF